MKHYRRIQGFDRALAYMIFSSIASVGVGLFAKLGMQVSSLTLLVFVRFFVPFILILFILIPLGTLKRAFQSGAVSSQFLRGLFAASAQYFLFYYLTKATLFDAIMLWNTAPLFMPLISLLLYRHRIGKIAILSIVIGLIGVSCIMKPDQGIIDWFSIWGVLAALSTAFSQVMYGHNRGKDAIDINMFFLFFSGTVYSLIILVIFHLIIAQDMIEVISPLLEFGAMPYLFILLLSLSSIFNQYFRGKAYAYASPSILAPFFYVTVLFAGLVGWAVYGNVPDYLSIVGMVLIVMSSVIRFAGAVHTD